MKSSRKEFFGGGTLLTDRSIRSLIMCRASAKLGVDNQIAGQYASNVSCSLGACIPTRYIGMIMRYKMFLTSVSRQRYHLTLYSDAAAGSSIPVDQVSG